MKTAVTVLQEMMVKMGLTPEYECLSQTGPQHQAMFDYRCVAYDVVVKASARSKKEAKQEAARLMLQQLSRRGHPVPPPYAASAAVHCDPLTGPCAPVDARSYVALLKELCEEYRLASVEYELVGDTGPPHLRHFTVRARIGQHERVATATTKKAARQLVAEELYSYLRENLARVTRDFNEEDALVRAHEKAMERYTDNNDDARRPDLGQKISEYHLGLTARVGEYTPPAPPVRPRSLTAPLAADEVVRAAALHCTPAAPPVRPRPLTAPLAADEVVRAAALHCTPAAPPVRPRPLTAPLVADAEARATALAILQRSTSPTLALASAAEALHIGLEPGSLPPLHMLTLTGCAPELVFAGDDAAEATEAALEYVRRALISDAKRLGRLSPVHSVDAIPIFSN